MRVTESSREGSLSSRPNGSLSRQLRFLDSLRSLGMTPAIPNRLQSSNDVPRHQAGLEVFGLQLSRHRSKTPNYRSTTLTSTVAPHRPDVVVADRRRIVDDDLCSL